MTDDMNEPVVEVSVPAEAASVAILRSVAANVIARTDAPFDTVDDLRIAVAEACNRLLAAVPRAERFRLEMFADGDLVEARVSVGLPSGQTSGQPPGDGSLQERAGSALAWTIIEGLTDEAEETIVRGEPTIVMRMHTGAPER